MKTLIKPIVYRYAKPTSRAWLMHAAQGRASETRIVPNTTPPVVPDYLTADTDAIRADSAITTTDMTETA